MLTTSMHFLTPLDLHQNEKPYTLRIEPDNPSIPKTNVKLERHDDVVIEDIRGHEHDHLNTDLAIEDSFYAVAEIFAYSVISESQMLNLVESKIARETDPKSLSSEANLSLTNLLYHRRFLERHMNRTQKNLRIIEAGSVVDWPQSERVQTDASLANLLDKERKKLLEDYKYLFQRAESLSRMCETNMEIVIQTLQACETKEQIEEARSITSLTRLALFLFRYHV
ncbi:hypothetical protein N0V90_005963 [Kalmusia sp. IMI 367209]|nr:hypothetical protein N0V90_005963 [Kalmusia sp. IMI 367209]